MESRDIEFNQLPKRPTAALKGRKGKAFQIVINRDALDRVHAHGKTDKRNEVCGVMVGDVYHDGVGPYLHIEAVVEGVSAHGGDGQVTFTSAAWAHIHTTIDRDFAHLRIVGWYHTHPGHGVFLSGADLFLHENFFGLPWQVALVHDPKSREDGIFGSIDGMIKKANFSIESRDSGAPVSIAALPKMAPVQATVEATVKAPAPAAIKKLPVVAVQAIRPVPVEAPAPVKAPAPVEQTIAHLFEEPAPVQAEVEMKQPAAPRKVAHPVRTAGKIVLALVGLLMFTATGVLTGLVIQQLGWHLPPLAIRVMAWLIAYD